MDNNTVNFENINGINNKAYDCVDLIEIYVIIKGKTLTNATIKSIYVLLCFKMILYSYDNSF